MNTNKKYVKRNQRCSELELELAKLMESETQAREDLERKYVEGWEDGHITGVDEGFDRGYAKGVDDQTKRDLA